jgi:uncharacterized protein YndB with AHSA1/START domain
MVNHDSFVSIRTVRGSVATAYRAWSEVELKSKWFVGPAGQWTEKIRSFDFKVGGKEVLAGQMASGRTSHFDATYLDIVPNERIVYAYRMSVDDELISVSLGTVEFLPTEGGCEVKYTEQSAYYGSEFGHSSRIMGTEMWMDNLAATIEGGA